MQTVNEVVRDVLANPEAYVDAFPVSELEQVFVAFGPETAVVTMNGVSDLANGATISPEMFEEIWRTLPAQWSDGDTRFVRDESYPRDRVTMVNVPLREDSAFQRALENAGRRLDRWTARPTVWQDEAREWAQHMANLTAIDDPSMGTAQNYAGDGSTIPGSVRQLASMQDSLDQGVEVIRRHLEQSATPPRPDHYRVSPGRCACGFTSMFDGDMDHHVRGIVHNCDGVPKRFWLCECGASALCREVVTARNLPVSFSTEPFDPTNRAAVEHIWLCRQCCERRGVYAG